MFKLTSLSAKIISMALLLALIPLIIVYFVASSLFTEALITNIQQNLTAQAIQAGHSIDQFFYQRITDIKMLSQADLLEDDNTAKINQYLEEVQVENNLLHDIYVVLPSGEFIAAALDKNKISKHIQTLNLEEVTELFKRSLTANQGDVLVSNALKFDTGLKVILMTPITDDSNINVIKVLIIELDLKAVEKIVVHFDNSIIGNKSVYIVDNDGLVVVTPDKNSQLLKPFKDLKNKPDLLESFSNQGEDGSALYIDADNDHVVAGFADMEEFGINHALDWSIIGLAPIKDIAAPIYSLRNFLVLLILSLTLVTGLAAVLVGRSISKPILKIIKLITDISNGNLSAEIQLSDKGEIGQLSDSIRKMQNNIRDTANTAENIAEGNLDVNITVLSEQDILGKSLTAMVDRLREMRDEQAQQDWLKTGLNNLNEKVSGEQSVAMLGENVINFLTPYVGAQVGAFYLYSPEDNEDGYLKMIASHAYVWRKQINNKIHLTEGLVGQAAYERKMIVLTDVNSDYVRISSGLGELPPASILVSPFLYEGQLKGVVEFATLGEFTHQHLNFLNQVMPALGISVNTAESRTQMESLLNNSQQQTRELEEQSHQMLSQQQELQRVNEELQAQSEELQSQQEELREANEQLELRTEDLEQQKDEIRKKNDVLKVTQIEIERKAHELEVSGKYKSEFLANMSHELRTPLNAIMILSQILAENEEGNLTEEQADYMQTIYSAGADLLDLINEILDLSKVESGKVEIQPENFSLRELINKSIDSKFRAVATKKSINFDIEISSRVPETIYSGVLRVKQVLNNLLSNAFKFTHQGGIKLIVDYQQTDFFKDNKPYVSIQVVDSGIGIAKEKFQVIFEAFQQADGSTSRKYGGTGLGLSISRQLARLLGGDITIDSAKNQGSTFTFYLPPVIPDANVTTKEPEHIVDLITSNTILPVSDIENAKPILLITDNPQWAEQLNQYFDHCQEVEFIIIAHQDHAVTQLKKNACYCIMLDLDSISIDEIKLFDYLTQDEQLSKIPTIIYSSLELPSSAQQTIQYPNLKIDFIFSFESLAEQAKLCFEKTVAEGEAKRLKNKKNTLINKKILLVDDDVRNTFALQTFLQHKEMQIVIAHDGVEALSLLELNPDIDIILMDIMMPEMDGYEAMRKIREMQKFKKLPIIALTAKAMKGDKNKCIEAGASDYLTKPI
ncbi:response regulator, partial [Candidatus Albibeggiatoa sp. nov. BB20]|uniref:response regulator n=1 Tax=Candidatus Albibeggiatoa sp. nov. BB20 TaxID=3162723 RepID=UPI0033653C7F